MDISIKDGQIDILHQFLENESLKFRREHEREGIKLEIDNNQLQFTIRGGGFDMDSETFYLNDQFRTIRDRLTSPDKLNQLREILKSTAEEALGQTYIGIEAAGKRNELMSQIDSEVGKGAWRPAVRNLVKRFGLQTTINTIDVVMENSKK